MPLVVRTPRLTLDPLQPGDAAAHRRIVIDPRVGPMLFAFPPDWSSRSAAAFVADWRWQGRVPFRLAIREAGVLVGSIGLLSAVTAEIFFYLSPDAAGRGLASEAVMAFCPVASSRFALPVLRANVFTDNPASARVLEKCGFRHVDDGMGASAARVDPAPVWQYRREML